MPQATFTADFSQFTAATANAAKTVQAFQYRVDNVGPSIKRMVREFDGTRIKMQADIAVKSVERIGGATKLTESEQRKLNALVTEAIAKYKALGEVAPKELQDLATATSKAGQELKGAGQNTSLMAQGLKAIGPSLLAAFSIGTVTRFIGSVVDAGSELADLSKRVGISAESLQRLRAVGEPAGVALETIAKAATKMSRELAMGNASAVGAVKALGLSVEDLRGMQPDQAFIEIGAALAGIRDPMQRAALGFQIFGRQWDEVSQMVTTDMKDVAASATVMSDDTVKKLDDLGDAWTNLQRTVKNAVAAIVTYTPLADLGTRIREAREQVNVLPAPRNGRPDLSGGGVPTGLPGEDELDRIYLKLEQGNKAWNKHREVVDKTEDEYRKWADAVTKAGKTLAVAQLEQRFLRLNASGKLSAEALAAILKEAEPLRQELGKLPPVLEQIREEYQDVLPSQRLIESSWLDMDRAMRPLITDLERGAVAVQQYGVRLEYLTSRQLVPFLVSMNAAPGIIRSASTAIDVATRTLGQKIATNLKKHLTAALESIPQTIVDGILQNAGAEKIVVAVATTIGAGIGGAIGAAFGGPIGAAVGSAVGSMLGALVDKLIVSRAEKLQKGIRERFGAAISEGLAEAIKDAAEQDFGGNFDAAQIFNLDRIIEEGGGLNARNIDLMFVRLHDVFSLIEDGSFDAAQAQDVLNRSFKQFADYVTRDGALASAQLLEIIKLNDRFGTQSAAVADFVTAQTKRALGGLTTFLENAVVSSQQSAEAMGAAVFAAFEALSRSGASPLEALNAVTPILEKLDAQFRQAGFSGGAAFDQIRAMAALATDAVAGPMLKAITGLDDVLAGLHNSGVLTQEMFAGLASEVGATYTKLVAAGKGGDQALQLISPTLQTLWELTQDFEYAVDDATQALIDQAVAAGTVGNKHRSVQDQMRIAMERTAEAVEYLAEAFGYVADEANSAARAINRIPREVDIAVNYNERRNVEGAGGEGGFQGHAAGGVFSAPHLAMIAEGGQSEIIGSVGFMTRALEGALARTGRTGTTQSVTVNLTIAALDGADVERVVRSPGFRHALTSAVAGNDGGYRTDLRTAIGVR